MADHARSTLYDYKPNSNLVLESDRDRRAAHEPTGEAESLAGRLKSTRMGDRVARNKPAELEERLDKAKKKRERNAVEADVDAPSAAKRARHAKDFLSEVEQLEEVTYRPKTKETRAVWEQILRFSQTYLGDQSQDVLAGASEELLAIMKDDNMREPVKKQKCSELLGNIADDAFARLTNLCKAVTDYSSEPSAAHGAGALDENVGVSVLLHDDEEEEDPDEIKDDDDDDIDDNAAEYADSAAHDAAIAASAKEAGTETGVDEGLLPVHKIDAYWLQRELSKYFEDATVSQRYADDILTILSTAFGSSRASDLRGVENRLVALLDFDKFDLIKLILRNAAQIFYVTRLRQAQSGDEKAAITAEMAQDVEGGGPAILQALEKTQSSESWAADRSQIASEKVRREARAINKANRADEDTGDLPPILASMEGAGLARPGKSLDLESLAFSAGGHTMTNKRVELPPKSWRSQKKGYEEVHVPALKPRPLAADEREIPIAEIPEWARAAFRGMTKLNRVQSRLYETAMFTPENMLLCAPTGAGKTNVAMLSIMHELGAHMHADGSFDLSAFKIVYVAPMKALVQEVVQNFTQRLTEPYGIVVRELSGDINLTKAEVAETQIIVTTPEKWDVITRKSGDRTYTQLVRLIILDEVHLLHDDRGPVLEALVARTLRQVETTQEMVRIVGLSATLPNYEDVAAFLRVKPESGLFYFDNSYRPCPLQQQYIGITEKKPIKRFQLMNEITYEKTEEQAGVNQVLIFVHSRKETAKTAKALRDMAMAKDAINKFIRNDASREILQSEAETSVRDADLKDVLPYGFAIHHAGMVRTDRKLVEDLFADGHVQVLISTATLAWGVNLPAHTVIIKGTQVYSPEKGRWTELSPLDMVQMLGRAGRPAYDTFGEGIIITGHAELQFYLSLMNQQLPIESQLIIKLADNLNAEVVLGTVTSVKEASSWLGYTYLYVRMLQNPASYGIPAEEKATDPLLIQRRLDLVHSAAVLLDKNGLIRYDRKTGALQATALGRVASHYYVSHHTMSTYNQLMKPVLGDIELFRLFSLSSEFKNIVVRQEEKEELRKLLERVPIPVKESIEEPSAKVNVLLQAYISNLKLDGFALVADMVYIHQSAGRLMRAIFEICMRRGWASLSQRALATAKMIDHRQWQSASPLRQFSGALSDDILRKLERKEIPWERFYDLKPADLGELVRAPKLGKTIHKLVHNIPRLEVAAQVLPITRSLLRVDLTLAPDFAFDPKLHGFNESFWVFVEDADGEAILHHEFFQLKAKYAEEEHQLTFYVPLLDPLPPQYFVRIISDRWLHSETLLAVPFTHLILPERFLPHTELLDLAPLPVGALRNTEYQALYSSGAPALGPVGDLKFFNPIQTQTFPTLYESDQNAVVAAPSGAGKTVCAEFAVLRAFNKDADARVVYVAARQEVCHQRFEEWDLKFGKGLGKAVVELTGELASDLKLVERAHIVIATPRQWDVVSRRWQKRKAVADTALFIADELESIGSEDGPTYEIICSRMRFIAMQSDNPVRIVGLGMSLANARDVGDWLGTVPATTYNFHPQVRPVPLEIRLQGFDIANFGARLLAMSRPVYSACSSTAGNSTNQVLVFCPSRKQAQLTAIDIITYAAADGAPDKFLNGRTGADQIDAALTKAGIKDIALSSCLKQGVAFYHEGMRPVEKALIEHLYTAGAVGVVVSTVSASWAMNSARWGAQGVVIMGTELYDGREHKYTDYPIVEILHMMGRASRTAGDDAGRCTILCAGNRKDYLKKFLYEPLPVESHLHLALHDHFNAEIVNKIIETKQDALDYLTWTLLYRRLAQNPNYYNLQGVSHQHLSDFLSDLVDNTLSNLEASQCITVVDEMNVSALNLGKVAAYYYIAYTSLEIFALSVTEKTKLKGLLEILSNASEFDTLPMRHGEDKVLSNLARHMPLTLPPPAAGKTASQFHDVHIKANLLLQAYFSRRTVNPELRIDQSRVVGDCATLVQALIDVIATEGWLKPALAAMELSQMLVQGLWADKDSVLLQVPHVTREMASTLEGLGGDDAGKGQDPVETVFDLMAMDDGVRAAILRLSPKEMADVAHFCNRYPNIDVSYDLGGVDTVPVDGELPLTVSLTREAGTEGMDEGAGIGAVHAPFFPKPKAEGWWLLVGEPKTNQLLGIKRVTLSDRATVRLDLPAPSSPGRHELTLYFMCDSYLGCDQEYQFEVNVTEAVE